MKLNLDDLGSYKMVGNYAITKSGEVYSLHFNRIKKVKLIEGNKGYFFFNLYEHGKKNVVMVHRLVAMLFLSNDATPEKFYVCHADGNKKNNCVENLYWGTPKQNAQDRIKHGTHMYGEKNHRARLTNKDALEILRKKGTISSLELSKIYGVSKTVILGIWKRRIWKHLETLELK
jgi:hypothetical protein